MPGICLDSSWRPAARMIMYHESKIRMEAQLSSQYAMILNQQSIGEASNTGHMRSLNLLMGPSRSHWMRSQFLRRIYSDLTLRRVRIHNQDRPGAWIFPCVWDAMPTS